jgi:hypothetical protein
MKLLTQLLCEEPTPEAPKRARYGQYLFAPSRSEEGVPQELNTKQEQDLFFALGHYIEFNDHPEGELLKIIPQIKDALKKHYYAPVLDSENHRVYRGITMEESDLQKILSPYAMKIERDEYVTCNLPGKLSPLKGRHLQGWSTKPDVASDTAQTYGTETMIIVLFVARTNAQGNVFFGKPGLLASIVGAGNMVGEEEVISIGKVEYDGFAYFAEGEKSFYVDSIVNAAIKVK